MNTLSALQSSSAEALKKWPSFKLKYKFWPVINFLLAFVFYFIMGSLIYKKETLQ